MSETVDWKTHGILNNPPSRFAYGTLGNRFYMHGGENAGGSFLTSFSISATPNKYTILLQNANSNGGLILSNLFHNKIFLPLSITH